MSRWDRWGVHASAVLAWAGGALLIVLAVLLLSSCSRHGGSEAAVREACARHHGVAAVSGNGFRKYVACRDGYFKVVR